MFIDIILYKWYKINVFIIKFSFIIRFISIYLNFCKYIASMDITLKYQYWENQAFMSFVLMPANIEHNSDENDSFNISILSFISFSI